MIRERTSRQLLLNVLKGCRCSYEFLSFLFQTHSFKISFNLAIKHTYKHHFLFSFLYLLSSSCVHREQSRASALSISAEVKKTSLLPHERDLVTSEPPPLTQKHISFPVSLAAIFSHNYSLTAFISFHCTSKCHFLL